MEEVLHIRRGKKLSHVDGGVVVQLLRNHACSIFDPLLLSLHLVDRVVQFGNIFTRVLIVRAFVLLTFCDCIHVQLSRLADGSFVVTLFCLDSLGIIPIVRLFGSKFFFNEHLTERLKHLRELQARANVSILNAIQRFERFGEVVQPYLVRVICAHLFTHFVNVQVFQLNHIDQVDDFEAQKA